MSDNENTQDGATTETELTELTGAPAAPVEHDASERPAGDEETVPSSSPASDPDEVDVEDEATEEGEPDRHPSSAGFGTTAKFTGAREDLEAQRARIAELEGRNRDR